MIQLLVQGSFAHLRHLSLVVCLTERLTFVVRVLTGTERYFHLGETFFVDKQSKRNDGLSGIFARFLQFAQLAFGEQQFTVPLRLMVRI